MCNEVGTIKTGNTVWTVRVIAKRFYASAPGFSDVSGDTWDAMENNAKVQASKAKVKVDVPYIQVIRNWSGGPERVVRNTATGINAGTGNVTYRDERGKAGQEAWRVTASQFLKPMPPEDEKRWLELREQIRVLNNQRQELERKYWFEGGLKAEVQRAIDAEHERRAQKEAGSE